MAIFQNLVKHENIYATIIELLILLLDYIMGFVTKLCRLTITKDFKKKLKKNGDFISYFLITKSTLKCDHS